MRAVRAPAAFDGERFIEGGATVLVDGAEIVGVEPYGFDLPADVELTTYDGTVLPGLVDAHVHLVSDSAPGRLEAVGEMGDDEIDAVIRKTMAELVAGGVTTVRDLGDRRYRTLAFRDDPPAGTPRIVASGPPFTTQGGHCHYLGGAAEGPEAIRAAMAEHVERGVDVIKVMASGGMMTPGTDQLGVQFTPEDLALIVSLAHEAGLPCVAHTHSVPGAWHAVRAGVDGLEHFTCLTEEGPRNPSDLLDAIAKAGIVVDQTVGWNLAAIDVSLMPPALFELIQRLDLLPEQLVQARAEQARLLRDRGVAMVTGTDSGVSIPKRHGDTTWRAIVELTASHPLEEALASATSYAAQVLGLGSVTGRLRRGLAADLLVVDGDVRADPTALGRPVAVVVRGCVSGGGEG